MGALDYLLKPFGRQRFQTMLERVRRRLPGLLTGLLTDTAVPSAERARDALGSPLPDWGKPEALMSLAYSHLSQKPPDLDAAGEEAHAALRLQPEWSYVRDVLLPQIEAARKAG
ncbi:MAG TPA: hypothetical protein VGM86_00920 [Thermoanaerobaculia bacterium]